MPFNPLKGLTAICCRRKTDMSKKSSKNSSKSKRKSVRRRSPSNLSEEECSRKTADGTERSNSSSSSEKKSSSIISVSPSKWSEEKPKEKSEEMTRSKKRITAGSSRKVLRHRSSERNKDSTSSSRKRRQKIKSQEENSAKAKPGHGDSGSEDEVIDYWTNPEGIQKKDRKQDEEKRKADEIKEEDMHTAIATDAEDDRLVLSIVQEPNIAPDLPSKEKIEEEKKAKELDSSRRGQKQVGLTETQNVLARAGLALWKRQKFRGGKQQGATKVPQKGASASASATPKSISRRLFAPRKISSAKSSLRQKAKIFANQNLKRLSAERVDKSEKFVKARRLLSARTMQAKQNLPQKAHSAETMVKNNMIKQQLPPKASSAEVLMKSQEKLSNEKPKSGSDENVFAQVMKESPASKFSPGKKKKFAYKASKQYVVAGPAKPKVTRMPPIKQPTKPTVRKAESKRAVRLKSNKVESTQDAGKEKSQETLEKTAELLYPSPAQEREQKAKEDH